MSPYETTKSSELSEMTQTGSKKPSVVVMIPARKGLHPAIVKKANAALHALENSNPDIDLTIFIFDKQIKSESHDRRPLSKVARVRNVMLEEAAAGRRHDYVLWLDSDLVEFPPDLPSQLVRAGCDGVIAPLVLIEGPGPLGIDQFYDTTAFIRKGRSGMNP
eukprot:CAMPEP_0113689344 /NCGR_PEP_ID=MMETSP0038_2-20120614/17103_1 /TAXON_ID=2898 /ORGANISM="Cryptomonas paramecium" /LENGTH=161 /DNA_ID=CAMNT_0000610387 /DNA_START=311 /DNA_END=792 /DNA_ORIENTATION=- /assembly_acc=CAM_ASM_000170